MSADLVTIIETVAVTQLLTPAGKALGETILERGKEMVGKAVAYLAAVGREPQSVSEKLLVPMALGAGLEDDPTLADKWAALLANAADTTQRVTVQPSFVEALRLLTADDAQVLEFIYTWEAPGKDFTFIGHGRLIFAAIFTHFGWPKDRMELSIDNLLRQRFFSILTGGFDSMSDPDPDGIIAPTTFGKQFMLAVTPPSV